MINRVTVYCSSSAAIPKKYFDATRALAKALVANNIEAVFGGGAVGLMGALADTMVAGGGKIKGIMPTFMKDVEWAHPLVTDFEFVPDMAERKHRFLIDTDALIALPGGTGTYEELFEAMSLKRLGKFHHPIVVLNTDGFYDPIKAQMQKCIDEKFMHPRHADIWTVVDEPDQVLPSIRETALWDADAIEFATLRE